jgi:hypothetical protein
VRQQATNQADRSVLRALHRGRSYQPRDEAPSAPFAALLEDFETALRARTESTARFVDSYDDANRRTSAAVIELFRGCPPLRDVLLVSNEDAYPRLVRWLDSVSTDSTTWCKGDRANAATLVRYLQRVCAKNDTTSHFGPLAPARIDTSVAGVHWSTAALERHTAMSRWAVEELARRLADDVRFAAVLRPRRAPCATVEDGTLHVARIDQRSMPTDVRQAVRVDPPVELGADRALYELCDGRRTVRELADELSRRNDRAVSVTEVLRSLHALAALGAVVVGPEFPYGLDDGLGYLEAWAQQADDDGAAARCCRDFRSAVARLGAVAPEERPDALAELKASFTAVTGLPPRREATGFYSDRSVFHEHCVGFAGDLRIGEPLVTRMHDELGLLYDMFLLRPRWRLNLERRLLARWFDERFGRDAVVTVPRYLGAYVDDLEALEPRYARVDAEVAVIGDALEDALLPPVDSAGDRPLHRHEHVVERAVVEQLVARYGVAEPAVCNPDLMVASASPAHIARGECRLVVGDLHAMDDHLSHGSIAPFVDRAYPHYRREMATLYAGLLEPGEHLADVTQCHLNKTFPRIEPEGWDVEAFDASGRPAERRLRLGELSVASRDGRLRLLSPTGDVLRLLLPPLAWPMLRRNPFAVFGFPTGTDEVAVDGRGRSHLPRIRVGDVVLQRELWRVEAASLAVATVAEDAQGFLRCQELRARLGLPRHVYVRCPGEPKPVYCDLDSPLLVRQLTRMAATAAGDVVTLSEMLPGPDELWLADVEGARTSELRYAVFTAAQPEGGQ